MKNINGEILSLDLMNITDNEKGTVTTMTKILYRIETDDTDVHVGPAVLECFKQGNHLEKLKPFCRLGKIVHIDIENKMLKNGAKYVITKVDNVEL